MHAKINTRIAVERGPGECAKRDPPMAENQRKKDGQAETVGGMAWDKTVSSTPVTVHDIDEILKIGVMRWPKPFKKRFEERWRNLIAAYKDKDKKNRHQQRFLAGSFIEKKK